MVNTEAIAFKIISCAGDGIGKLFAALKEAKKGNFGAAEALVKEGKKKINEAHKVQTGLLVGEANGEQAEINILMIHAQDHLMNSVLAKELISEMIDLYKTR
jgi:cellobiose PTS system EIIA component